MVRDTLANTSKSTKTVPLATPATTALSVSAPLTQPTLPAVLSKRDLTVLMLLIILFIANTNDVQFAGPSVFIYWVLGFLTFLVPCAYV
ncbi:MAG TPA: hypothetical protein VGT82_08540, partial [Ktedonobacteraceae bacterium]|nr:hypothetical protein [Ktedonobacteraceae bacterium]